MTFVRSRYSLALFTAVLLALPFSVKTALAESQARIVRLSDVQGDVRIDRRTGEGFESALENLPITEGTRLETRDEGRAEIEFEDGSTVRLAPNSSLEFSRLSLHDSGGKNTEIELNEGTAFFNIDLGKRDDFVVDVGHRSINLERSARFRASIDRQSGEQAHVAVSRGEVTLTGQGTDAVAVDKNRTASFDLSNSDHVDVARGYDDSAYDDWNDDLDSYHARNYSRANTDSPYAYGLSDLNYYGSYISDPGVGSCWRPYFASFGWDPFADGTWVWYPGFGYTWVSSYPWGWAPYRYGSWQYLDAAGWCWQPGAWNQWIVVPRYVRTPPHWVVPVPPANGHGRVPRIRGVVAGDPASRFGDPTRRVVREGPDGQTLWNHGSQSGEAGLGVPRGFVKLGKLPAAPVSGSPGFEGNRGIRGYDPDLRGRSTSGGSLQGGGSRSGPSAPAPRAAPPAPAPRTSPPRSAPPASAPRGGKIN